MAVRVNYGIKIITKSKRKADLMQRMLPTLGGWQKAIEQYCAAYKGKDAPYNYNERANVSLLAGGAWKSGAVALEEYTAQKEQILRIKRKGLADEHRGRADLLIMIPGRDSCDIQVEAKQVWGQAQLRKAVVQNRVEAAFAKAVKDAQRYSESSYRIGCIFCAISFPKDRFPTYKNSAMKLIRKQIIQYIENSADLWAWCFPKNSRHLLLEEDDTKEKRYWPGVLVGMKVVGRGPG